MRKDWKTFVSFWRYPTGISAISAFFLTDIDIISKLDEWLKRSSSLKTSKGEAFIADIIVADSEEDKSRFFTSLQAF